MKTFKKLEISPSYLITNMNIKASTKFKVGKMIDNAWSIHRNSFDREGQCNYSILYLENNQLCGHGKNLE